MKRAVIQLMAFVFGMTAVVANAQSDDGSLTSKHGFILVGEEEHYLYHLAKYNSPHQYLAVFAVDLFSEGQKLEELPLTSRGTLSALSEGQFQVAELGRGTRKEFAAQLFDGYLRSDDKEKIGAEIKIRIDHVIYFNEITPERTQPDSLEYVGFGTPSDFYLAHHVTGAPNYEQLLSVDVVGGRVPTNGSVIRFDGYRDDEPLEVKEANFVGTYDDDTRREVTLSAPRVHLYEPMPVASPSFHRAESRSDRSQSTITVDGDNLTCSRYNGADYFYVTLAGDYDIDTIFSHRYDTFHFSDSCDEIDQLKGSTHEVTVEVNAHTYNHTRCESGSRWYCRQYGCYRNTAEYVDLTFPGGLELSSEAHTPLEEEKRVHGGRCSEG